MAIADHDRTGARWATLLALSALFVAALEVLHFPAALLLGPMAAAIIVSVRGAALSVSRLAFDLAQGAIGCMIARNIPPSAFVEMLKDWPLFLIGVVSVIAVSNALGWLLARFRVLPGTTAVWGSFPGAATTMMLMAEAYGGDVRLVAFMQYLRVVMVVVTASLVSRFLATPAHGVVVATQWFPPIAWKAFALTLALVAGAVALARMIRLPAGPLLLPLVAGFLLEAGGYLSIELPPWLLAISYMLVGWSIGLRFTPVILAHAMRALPRLALAIACLIGICGLFSVLLMHYTGLDPLTSYLAMSPGGADSVAIIAASTRVNVPFVMAMQTLRFIIVLIFGPAISRFIAKRARLAQEAG